ncbi:MAG: 4Fe-4S binding protein [Candidatus Heimdallarchaeota archaeon]|nr:MAG: 4Fe-4S binding protein [Candidatus Heimdallarchaeota archaeon]
MVSYSQELPMEIATNKIEKIRAPELNGSKCTKCGLCIEVCPQNVFSHKDEEYIVQQPEKCIECGACVLNCRGDAISFEPFPGCGCIWNATFRRLRSIISWRKSVVNPPDSCCGTK